MNEKPELSPDGATVRLVLDGPVARLWLHNPTRLNAINAAMWGQIKDAFDSVSANGSVRCVVVSGSGDKAFAAGGDIEEFQTVRATVDEALHYHDEQVARALDAIRDCPVPTLAAIRGACIGGGLEIAGCCDLRIATRSSRFGAPIMKLGFSMYPGEMAGLLALVGPAVLLEILLEGRILDADEALAKGLLTRVVDDEAFEAAIQASIDRICAGAPLVARAHKFWVRRLMAPAPLTEQEKRTAFDFLATEDYREGIDAFLAKRSPCFQGR